MASFISMAWLALAGSAAAAACGGRHASKAFTASVSTTTSVTIAKEYAATSAATSSSASTSSSVATVYPVAATSAATSSSVPTAYPVAATPDNAAPGNTTDGTDIAGPESITLGPLVVSGADTYIGDPMVPQDEVHLCYGLDNARLVNITVTTPTSAIKLEAIDSLASVDCSTSSVSMTFADAASLNMAYSQWSAKESLVLVTNHLGDCDAELERGFFVASNYVSHEANLTLVATTEKKTVADVGSYLRAAFEGLPTSSTAGTPRRRKRVSKTFENTTLEAGWDLPDIDMVAEVSTVTAKANGTVDMSLTLSGYLDFNIWRARIDSLYVDVAASSSTHLDLAIILDEITHARTLSYEKTASFQLVAIPGVLTFGPELVLDVGANVSASATGSVGLELGADIDAATLHLDLVGNGTRSSGWDPEFSAGVTLAQNCTASVTPYMSVAVELGFKILGGLMSLSSGLKPSIAFPMTIATHVEGDQTLLGGGDATTNTTLPHHVNTTLTHASASPVNATGQTWSNSSSAADEAVCTNGISVARGFEFKLDAFITKSWTRNLVDSKKDLASKCYSW